MSSVRESEAGHRDLYHDMKKSSRSHYTTALSVIQGVALADLASVVAAGYKQFTVAHWLLVVLCFCTLIIIWNQYMVQCTIWLWVPDIRDSVLPFVFGALELGLNHTIMLSLSVWLVIAAFIPITATVNIWLIRYRANEEDENKELLKFLYRRFLEFSISCLVFSAILIILAIISHVNHLEPSEGVLGGRGVLVLGFLLFIAGCVVVWEILSARSWSTIVNHFRSRIQAEAPAE